MKLTEEVITQLINCIRFSDWNSIHGYAEREGREIKYNVFNNIVQNWKDIEKQLLNNLEKK